MKFKVRKKKFTCSVCHESRRCLAVYKTFTEMFSVFGNYPVWGDRDLFLCQDCINKAFEEVEDDKD